MSDDGQAVLGKCVVRAAMVMGFSLIMSAAIVVVGFRFEASAGHEYTHVVDRWTGKVKFVAMGLDFAESEQVVAP